MSPPRIACLHTAASNVAIFDAAAAPLGATLVHAVRADLLAAAEAAGGLSPTVRADTERALRGLEASCDALLLTCSTLGPAVDAADGAVPWLRVDAALAGAAASAAGGGPVLVLCAVETTLGPTGDLFERTLGRAPALRLVEGAWERFRSGDVDGYLDRIAAAADAGADDGFAVVALAQASMAPAVSRCARAAPLASPASGLAAAIAATR